VFQSNPLLDWNWRGKSIHGIRLPDSIFKIYGISKQYEWALDHAALLWRAVHDIERKQSNSSKVIRVKKKVY
jgi:hypothetical protein